MLLQAILLGLVAMLGNAEYLFACCQDRWLWEL